MPDYSDMEPEEAYECGYEEGYKAAMKEAEPEMGERYGMRGSYGRRGYDESSMGERHMMGERRGRDSMGRYR